MHHGSQPLGVRLRVLRQRLVTDSSPSWTDPYSPEGKREAAARVLTGVNSRVFYEGATQRRLLGIYRDLRDLANAHPSDEAAWRTSIKKLLAQSQGEGQIMREWLIGLTKKTADNLEMSASDYPALFDEMMKRIEQTAKGKARREMALLLWCGTATLTIRGSMKSRTGKALEKILARTALTAIGLDEAKGDFRLNIGADAEVERETDAEIRTHRGFVRMEIGLIGKGNSEVISDKVGRMDRNGIIMLDVLPKDSSAYQTASNRGVCLIQIRNGHPVEALRSHLASLGVPVQEAPISSEEVQERILAMPLSAFNGG